MNRFFAKKYIFAAILLTSWILFSVMNFAVNASEWYAWFAKIAQVQNVVQLDKWITDTEKQLNEELLCSEELIDIYGYVQKLLGKREFNQFAFIRDDDGMLYEGSTWPLRTEEMVDYAGRVRRLNEYVESRGAKLLVVLPPSKILSGVSNINRAWPLNDPNARMDRLLMLLYQNGVEAVDLRVKMQESGASVDELFFKTDHHWTPLAGFYAAQEIVDQVRERFDDDWDPEHFYTDLDSYNMYTYSKCMLGSSGRNTGAIYSGMEDYTLLWPKFPTDFKWIDYEKNTERKGSFAESLMDASELEIDDLYNSSVNRVYLREITDKDKIINYENPKGVKLKVLRDSYFSPTACFLAPMCSEIEMMWTRASEEKYDLDAFIQDGEYDYFILEIYPHSLNERSFMFFEEPEE